MRKIFTNIKSSYRVMSSGVPGSNDTKSNTAVTTGDGQSTTPKVKRMLRYDIF
jgi:hypothetical protein